MQRVWITSLTSKKLQFEMAHIKLFDQLAAWVFFFYRPHRCWRGEHGLHLMLGNHPPERRRIWCANRFAFKQNRRAARK